VRSTRLFHPPISPGDNCRRLAASPVQPFGPPPAALVLAYPHKAHKPRPGLRAANVLAVHIQGSVGERGPRSCSCHIPLGWLVISFI
jgi:hypothetical protein